MGQFLNGFFVGLGIAFLVAPKRGEEMRTLVSQRLSQLRSTSSDNQQYSTLNTSQTLTPSLSDVTPSTSYTQGANTGLDLSEGPNIGATQGTSAGSYLDTAHTPGTVPGTESILEPELDVTQKRPYTPPYTPSTNPDTTLGGDLAR